MNPDFSNLMAQQIAQARPKQAPGGGGRQYGRAPTVGRSTAVKANVNLEGAIEGMSKLFGWKTPDEKEAIAQQIVTRLEATPEGSERDTLINDTNSQMLWESLENAKVPLSKYGIRRTGEQTALGHPVYGYTPISAEARVAGKTKEQIQAGAAGAGPRQKSIEAEQQTRPYGEGELLAQGGTPAQNIISGRRAIAAPDPGELEIQGLQKKLLIEQTKIQQTNLSLVPQEFALKEKEFAEKSAYYAHLNKEIDLRIAQMGREASAGLTKEDQKGLLAADHDFQATVNQINKVRALKGESEENMFELNQDLATAAFSTINRKKFYTDDPKASAGPVFSWFTNVAPEFDRATAGGTKYFGLSNTPTKEAVDQIARRKAYVKTGVDLLKTSGMIGPESKDLYKTIGVWSIKAGYSNEQILRMYQSLGFSQQAATQIINELAQ